MLIGKTQIICFMYYNREIVDKAPISFIVVSSMGWEKAIDNNARELSLELSKRHKVIYVNSISTKRDDTKTQINNNLWVLTPKSVPFKTKAKWYNIIFRYLNKYNNISFARSILRSISDLDFGNYVVINDNDLYHSYYLNELLFPRCYIYYLNENLTSVSHWFKKGKRYLPKHLKKADIVMTPSIHLRDYAQKFNKNTHHVGQGCNNIDYNPNKEYKIPSDIRSIQKPIVGFIGDINHNTVDLHLIETIAQRLKSWNIVLVGNEDSYSQKSRLHAYKNVHFLGEKPIPLHPFYINCFDVTINPQKTNSITFGTYPHSIDQYLAMGKICVSSKTAPMEIFKNHCMLVDNNNDFPLTIEKAFQTNTKSQKLNRYFFAKSHSWSKNVDMMESIITESIQKKPVL